MSSIADLNHVYIAQSCVERLYHFWVEAVMGQLANKGQTALSCLPHKVLFHTLYGLKVVLQQSRKQEMQERQCETSVSSTSRNITPHSLVCNNLL